MATKSMSYDHPAYTSVDTADGSMTGSAGTTTKFVAFTAKLLKSVTLRPTSSSTSNDVTSLITVTGTTTTTTAIATFGSGVLTATNVALTTAALPSLNQGDLFWCVKGTDASAVISVSIENVVAEFANVTL